MKHLNRLFVVALLLSLAACANPYLSRQGVQAQSVPMAPHLFPFDAAKQGATIDELVKIPKERYWIFRLDLIFPYYKSTIHELNRRVCEGPEESYIPISLQVYFIDDRGNESLVYDGIKKTKECDAWHWETSSIREVIFDRHVKLLYLKRGLYRFKATTLRNNTFYKGFRSVIDVSYDPRY